MSASPITSLRGPRDSTPQLQLVRRYARILRETTAETRAARRATATAATSPPADPRMARDAVGHVSPDARPLGH